MNQEPGTRNKDLRQKTRRDLRITFYELRFVFGTGTGSWVCDVKKNFKIAD